MLESRARALRVVLLLVCLVLSAHCTGDPQRTAKTPELAAEGAPPTNLVTNGSFDTEIAPCVTTQLDADRNIVSSPTRMSLETSDTHDGRPSAVRVTYAADPPLYESATHNSGLTAPFSSVVPTGTWLKVEFWAKALTQPLMLEIMKAWGGSSPAFASLDGTWRRYEVYTHAEQDTSSVIFTITPNADAVLQHVALGSYLIDDIRAEVVAAPPAGCGTNANGSRDSDNDGTPDCSDLCPADATNQCNSGPAPTLCGAAGDRPCKPECPNGQCGLALLDQLATNARAAYSVADRLHSSYLGPAFRVRRGSDGAEANIGFGRVNILDESQIASFCGASDCFLSVLFDQSDAGYDLRQPFAANQLKVYDGASRSMRKTNGRPVIALGEVGKSVSRADGLGLAADAAITVVYSGRLSGGQVGAKIFPLRIGAHDGAATAGSELALGYGTYADVGSYGGGLLSWSNLRSGELHRSALWHAGGTPVSSSGMVIEGTSISTSSDTSAQAVHFNLADGGPLLLGKLAADSADAEAELQTIAIWSTMFSGESLFTAQALMQVDTDQCPNDPVKVAPGVCGCGVPEAKPCVVPAAPTGTRIPSKPAASALTPLGSTYLPGIMANYHEATPPMEGYFSDLRYAARDGQHEVPKFCDANGNPIPTPTEAQLNAAPPEGSRCLGLVAGAVSDCPIDPASLTDTACTIDSDCPANYVCGTKCADALCTVLEHYCGKHATSCSGVGPEVECEDYNLCPASGSVGTDAEVLELAQLRQQQLAPTTTSASIAPTDQAPLPGFEPASQAELCLLSNQRYELHDAANKPGLQNPQKKWGVYATSTTDYGLKPEKASSWAPELDVHASAGFAFGGIIWGNKLDVLAGEASAVLNTCGVSIIGTAKVMGEAVATLSATGGLETSDGQKLTTKTKDSDACKAREKEAKDAQTAVRTSYLFAREVGQYYADNGLTQELCNAIVKMVPSAEKDSLGSAYNCADLEFLPAARKVSLLEHWKQDYDVKAGAYPNYQKQMTAAHADVQTSGTIDLFELSHPYSVSFEQDFPIGPISLHLALEAYGSWSVKGGLQWGLGFETTKLTNTLKGMGDVIAGRKQQQPDLVGDLSVYAGPVIAPDLNVGVLAYVGVGVPGVSVGIEGQITLLEAKLPIAAVAAAMRVSEEDRRDRTGTDYAGMLKPGLPSRNYQWVLGYNWSAVLEMHELDGKLDLAARLRLLFFKKTFRLNLFNWRGFSQKYLLVAGGGGDALDYASDLGKQAETLAYTEVVPLSDPDPRVTAHGPTPRVCQIAPD